MYIYINIWLLFYGIPVYDQFLLQKSTYFFKVPGQMHRRIHQTKLARTSRSKRLLSMKLRTGYVLFTFFKGNNDVIHFTSEYRAAVSRLPHMLTAACH